MAYYLSNPEVKKSFILYVDFVFDDKGPQSLCEKIRYKCCAFQGHLASCLEKWMELYRFIIADIGLVQFESEQAKASVNAEVSGMITNSNALPEEPEENVDNWIAHK